MSDSCGPQRTPRRTRGAGQLRLHQAVPSRCAPGFLQVVAQFPLVTDKEVAAEFAAGDAAEDGVYVRLRAEYLRAKQLVVERLTTVNGLRVCLPSPRPCRFRLGACRASTVMGAPSRLDGRPAQSVNDGANVGAWAPQVPLGRIAIVCVVVITLLLLLLLQSIFTALKSYTPAAYMPVVGELAQELVVLGLVAALIFALNLSSVPRDISLLCFGTTAHTAVRPVSPACKRPGVTGSAKCARITLVRSGLLT